MKTLLHFLLLLTLATFVASCSDDTPVDPATAPKITAFTATPGSIGPGDSARLAWTIEGTTTAITIDNGVGDVTSTSSKVVYPVATTTYTMTATNDKGSTTKTVTVTVDNPGDPGAPPIPIALVATPGNPGVINLSWPASTGASSYQLERRQGSGAFALVSSPAVNSYSDVGLFPMTTFTYRVRAVSATGARSGWSRYATATVPGTVPVVARISITPTAPPTLRPGNTVQFTAVAYDAANNDLNLPQNAFTWNSSNPTVLSIDAVGKATAGTQLGSATITASVGTIESNQVNVSVAQQEATVLEIVHPENTGSVNYALYDGALNANGVVFDKIVDNPNNQVPGFTYDQIKNYQRIVFVTRWDGALNGATIAILKKYLDQPGKRLVIICHSYLFSGDAGFRSYIGLTQDGYTRCEYLDLTVVGGVGTSMAGFSVDRQVVQPFVSDLTLKTQSNTLPALIATDARDGSQVIVAMETTLASGSKIFYSGLLLENMDPDKHNAFMARLMSGF